MRKVLSIVATSALLVLGLQGCSEGTPSKDDLSSIMQDETDIEASVADCVADELLDADLSDKQLNAVADDDRSDLSGDEEAEIVTAITEAVTECAAG